MRLGRVRVGTRFVFEDRGGLWEKVTEGKARCFFGKRDEFGTEIDIGQEDYVFALFDRPEPMREPARERAAESVRKDGAGVKVVVIDEDDRMLLEVEDAGAAQVAAFASSENIQLKPERKRTYRNYMVSETYYRPGDNSLCVEVREDRVIGRDDEDEERPRVPVRSVPPKARVPVAAARKLDGPTGEARPVEVPRCEGPSGQSGVAEASSGPTGPVGPSLSPTGELVLVPPWSLPKTMDSGPSSESAAPSAILEGGTEGKAAE